MSLPDSFRDAEWRSTTREDHARRRIGASFTLADGSVVRLALDKTSARSLAETLIDYLTDARIGDQRPTSIGNPKRDGSPQEGQ